MVEAVAAHTRAKDLRGLDTLYAHYPWGPRHRGRGVNNGWIDYRDHHYFDVEPQVRGNVAWAAFRYELAVDTPQGHVEVEGRGTVILEKRGERWLVVHLHTSGRRRGGPR